MLRDNLERFYTLVGITKKKKTSVPLDFPSLRSVPLQEKFGKPWSNRVYTKFKFSLASARVQSAGRADQNFPGRSNRLESPDRLETIFYRILRHPKCQRLILTMHASASPATCNRSWKHFSIDVGTVTESVNFIMQIPPKVAGLRLDG